VNAAVDSDKKPIKKESNASAAAATTKTQSKDNSVLRSILRNAINRK